MKIVIAASVAALLVAQPLSAQTGAPSSGAGMGLGQGLGGRLGGLLGGGLPDIGSTGVGNAAGLLGYCIKSNVLGGANATSLLGRLTGREEVTRSPGFLAGQRGQVQTGDGNALSLAGLKGQLKTRVCDMVLKRASSLVAAPARP